MTHTAPPPPLLVRLHHPAVMFILAWLPLNTVSLTTASVVYESVRAPEDGALLPSKTQPVILTKVHDTHSTAPACKWAKFPAKEELGQRGEEGDRHIV